MKTILSELRNAENNLKDFINEEPSNIFQLPLDVARARPKLISFALMCDTTLDLSGLVESKNTTIRGVAENVIECLMMHVPSPYDRSWGKSLDDFKSNDFEIIRKILREVRDKSVLNKFVSIYPHAVYDAETCNMAIKASASNADIILHHVPECAEYVWKPMIASDPMNYLKLPVYLRELPTVIDRTLIHWKLGKAQLIALLHENAGIYPHLDWVQMGDIEIIMATIRGKKTTMFDDNTMERICQILPDKE